MSFTKDANIDAKARNGRQLSARRVCPGGKVLVSIIVFAAPAAKAVTLFDLLQPNASIVSGNLEFSNFRNFSQSGALNVSQSGIFVDPIASTPVSSETEYGLRFSSAQWFLAGPNLTYAMAFDYDVSTLSGLPLITDSTLKLVGGPSGAGSATVAQEIVDQLTTNTVVTNQVFFNENNDILQFHSDFPGIPYTGLEIRTAFTASTGAAPDSVAFVSHYDETFSQIPESGTASLIVFSALAILSRTGRNRAGKQVP